MTLKRTATRSGHDLAIPRIRPEDRESLPAGGALERLRGLPAAAAGRRGLLTAPAPDDLDVADPVGLPDAAMSVAAEQIERALRPILRVLGVDLPAGADLITVSPRN